MKFDRGFRTQKIPTPPGLYIHQVREPAACWQARDGAVIGGGVCTNPLHLDFLTWKWKMKMSPWKTIFLYKQMHGFPLPHVICLLEGI